MGRIWSTGLQSCGGGCLGRRAVLFFLQPIPSWGSSGRGYKYIDSTPHGRTCKIIDTLKLCRRVPSDSQVGERRWNGRGCWEGKIECLRNRQKERERGHGRGDGGGWFRGSRQSSSNRLPIKKNTCSCLETFKVRVMMIGLAGERCCWKGLESSHPPR